MVEFVIASSAFLLVLFGIVEFARVLYTYHTVSNAARLGSRWAIVRGSSCAVLDHCNATSDDVQTFVRSVVPMVDAGGTTISGCDVAGLCVLAAWSASTNPGTDCTAGGTNTPGHVVCVTVKYPFSFAIPFVSSVPLVLQSTSKMVVAN